MGSAAGGLLFDVAWLPNASFLLMTILTMIGVLLSLGLPKMLMTRKRDEAVEVGDYRHLSKPPSSAATGRPTA